MKLFQELYLGNKGEEFSTCKYYTNLIIIIRPCEQLPIKHIHHPVLVIQGAILNQTFPYIKASMTTTPL